MVTNETQSQQPDNIIYCTEMCWSYRFKNDIRSCFTDSVDSRSVN